MPYNLPNSSDSVRSSGKSGMSIDNAIRVIANAKTASLNDITCSNFIWGVNTPGVVILSVPYCFGLTPVTTTAIITCRKNIRKIHLLPMWA